MLSFIVQYWMQVLFGLIATGFGLLAKKFYNLWKKEQKYLKEKEEEELKESINKDLVNTIEQQKENSDKNYSVFQKRIDALEMELDILRGGLLSIQGKGFKDECRKLLHYNHIITPEEWYDISSEHDVYNSLGGNHDGDRLYSDVEIKYHNSLK